MVCGKSYAALLAPPEPYTNSCGERVVSETQVPEAGLLRHRQ